MNRFWKVATICAGGLGALGLLAVAPHYRLKWAVEDYRQELRAKGEKLEIQENAPLPVPVSSNGVWDFSAAVARLPRSDFRYQPTAMRCVSPGRARVAWKEEILPGDRVTNVWPVIEATVEDGRDALAAIQSALAKPSFQYDIDYRLGFAAPLPHLVPLKAAAQTLSAAVLADLHRGRIDEAHANLNTLALLVRQNRHEPLIISHLVRIAIASIALNTTWEALHCSGWTDPQLAALQNAWSAADLLGPLEVCFAMERAMGRPAFDQLRRSRSAFSSLGSWTGPTAAADGSLQGLLRQLYDKTGRYWAWRWYDSYDEELFALQAGQLAVETARRTWADQSFQATKEFLETSLASLAAAHSNELDRFAFAGNLESTVQRVVYRAVAADSQRRLLVAAIALQRHHLRHGEYPSDLNALVPAFVSAVPRDLMDGQPLRYRLRSDGSFLLYSVGEDGVDNGGDPTPAKPDEKPRHWNGRDWVWPSPASPEEVAESERKKK